MTARGIKTNWASPAGAGGNAYADYTAASINTAGTDLVVTGWMRIKGTIAGSLRGQVPFHIYDEIGTGAMFFDGGSASSPFNEGMKVFSAGETTYGSFAPATNEDWFYVIKWQSSTGTWTAYAAKDGAASVGSASSSAVGRATTTITSLRLAGVTFTFDWGSNVEVTNVKVWTGAAAYTTFDATALFAEMNSEMPVITSGLYAHWKLASASDLVDYSGNSRTLTATGTVTDGSMDPVDIQTATGSGCRWYGILKA